MEFCAGQIKHKGNEHSGGASAEGISKLLKLLEVFCCSGPEQSGEAEQRQGAEPVEHQIVSVCFLSDDFLLHVFRVHLIVVVTCCDPS